MTTDNSDLLNAIDQVLDERSLEWAARWIQDSLKGETDERVIKFGNNMAMTLRAAVQPAASTPTERATLDALVQMRHHDEHRQFDAATCPAWPCDVIREIRAAASREAQNDE